VKDKFAVGNRRIDTFLQTDKSDLLFVNEINSFNQMFEAPSKSIQFPNDERIACSAKFDDFS